MNEETIECREKNALGQYKKLTRVTKNDHLGKLELLLLVSRLCKSLASQVFNLTEAVVIRPSGFHLSTACFVE